MPRLNDDTMENQNNVGHFGFSGVRPDNLEASEYTLATIGIDTSGSVAGFTKEMEDALKECVKALQYSPRSDNLMLRVIVYNNDTQEIHGFKLLENCQLSDYDNCLSAGGMTALCDAAVNSIEGIKNYGKQLYSNDIDVNGIVILITDGMDNSSKFGPATVALTKDSCVKDEALESILTILVGVNVNDTEVQTHLSSLEKEGKFDQYVALGDAKASTIARLGKFISKSISSQSQSLGTGGPSQAINFNGSLNI